MEYCAIKSLMSDDKNKKNNENGKKMATMLVDARTLPNTGGSIDFLIETTSMVVVEAATMVAVAAKVEEAEATTLLVTTSASTAMATLMVCEVVAPMEVTEARDTWTQHQPVSV